VVGGFPDGDDAWLVVASNAGAASHPAWFHNLARHPDQVWVQVGNRTLRVAGESLLDARREEALRSIYASAPRYASYQRKTDREIPVVRLTRAGDPS
jgi:deazaflavin-dependent oxidoreductase (nitroreductase family)